MDDGFARGAQMALQMFQMQQGMRGQQMRSAYMQELMRNMQFQREQETKKQKALKRTFEPRTETLPPEPALGLHSEYEITTPSPGMSAMQNIYGPDYAQLAAELTQLGILTPEIPTQLGIYEAETRRMGAMPKGKEPKEPTPSMYEFFPIGKGQEQRYKWNPQTRAHDIPVGKPRPIFKPTDIKTSQDKQMTVIREIGQIIKRYGGDIDIYALALMDPAARNQYLKEQATDIIKRVKEPERKRLRQLYKKLEQLTEEVIGKLPQVETEKVLTPQKAAEFLMQAGGDKEKARQLATEQGYTW